MRSFARNRVLTLPLLATLALLVGAVGVLVDAAPSGASVTAIGGNVLVGPPPSVVPSSAQASNTFINFFTERTALTLPTSVPVDITPGSTFPSTVYTVNHLTPSTVAAGTPIDSYFMCSNPIGKPQTLFPYHGDCELQHSDTWCKRIDCDVGLC